LWHKWKKTPYKNEVWARDATSLSTTTSLPTCWIFRSKCFRVSIKCTTLENSHKHDTCKYASCLQKRWPQGWDNGIRYGGTGPAWPIPPWNMSSLIGWIGLAGPISTSECVSSSRVRCHSMRW
jgi:hypothetical protein